MERQPYNQSDASKGSKESGTSKPDRFSFAPIPITPSFERAERPAPAPRPVEVPLEGVINWRHDDDLRRRPDFDKPKEAKEKHEGDTEDDEDSNEDSSTTKAKQAAVAAAQQPAQRPVAQPRPIAEIIAETQAQQHQAEHKEEDRHQAEEAEIVVAEAPQAVAGGHVQVAEQAAAQTSEASPDDVPVVPQRPVAPLHTFPPVAPRMGEFMPAAATAEATDDDPATSAQPRPAQYQVFNPAPGATPLVGNPNNVNIPQQPVGAPSPNVYPGGALPNQANNTGNLPPVPPAGPGPNAAGNFNQPPMGPGGPGYNYNQAPYNPYNPVYANYNMTPGMPNANPNTAPVMPIERPIPASNRDPRVPAVAALLGAEYIFRKRADRKLEKRVNERAADQQAKLQERISTDNRIMQERQRQFSTEQQRQADEMQRMRYGQEYAAARPTAEQPLSGGLPRPFEAAPSGAERIAPARAGEARPMVPMGAERVVGRPEAQQQAQDPEQQANIADAHFDVRPDQRVEHSAWHNIVVDEHGHEVAGAIQYGEGFKRERQQEVIRDRMGDSGGMAGGGGMIAAGSPMQDQYGTPMLPGVLPSGTTNPALPPGQPTHADVDHQLQARNKQPSNLANPWFWIMLALIVAAFFTAATV